MDGENIANFGQIEGEEKEGGDVNEEPTICKSKEKATECNF